MLNKNKLLKLSVFFMPDLFFGVIYVWALGVNAGVHISTSFLYFTSSIGLLVLISMSINEKQIKTVVDLLFSDIQDYNKYEQISIIGYFIIITLFVAATLGNISTFNYVSAVVLYTLTKVTYIGLLSTCIAGDDQG